MSRHDYGYVLNQKRNDISLIKGVFNTVLFTGHHRTAELSVSHSFDTPQSAEQSGVKAMEGRGCSRERLLVQLILLLGAFVNVAFCTLAG